MMKNHRLIFLFAVLFATGAAFAETTIKEKLPDSAEESTTVIQRSKNPKLGVDKYEIVSEEDEIAGEPTAGTKEAYKAWKDACAEWKKEARENNKENSIITLSCGTAKKETDGTGNGLYTYKSQARMKVKVKLEAASR